MAWGERLAVLAAALWWGSLTAIGAVAVPTLFASLPTPSMAGQTAARLFTAQTWVAIGCGALLLLATRPREGQARMDGAPGFVLGGMLLALLSEFAVAPRIVARQNLAVWHTVGSAMFALQWVCALVALLKLMGQARHPRAGGDPAQRAGDGSANGRSGFPPMQE